MKILNEKGPIDHPYICGYRDEKIGIYARSLLAAKQKAIEYFKPKKKDATLMWVVLAEEDHDN